MSIQGSSLFPMLLSVELPITLWISKILVHSFYASDLNLPNDFSMRLARCIGFATAAMSSLSDRLVRAHALHLRSHAQAFLRIQRQKNGVWVT